MGKLWKTLLKKEAITRGWHLARDDARRDFSEDLYSTDIYGRDLKNHVQETIKRLRTNTYQPHPLFTIEVPKGTLAFRPGTVIPINDRVVLSAVVFLVAKKLDLQLPETVYSWRLKNPLPPKGPIFRETAITDIPFLKGKTIRNAIDPFEGWYQLWPQFDEETKKAFLGTGQYKFLATSDISAYFENIQLPILRDLLLTHLPKETELINLVFHFMESWSERTSDGRPYHRGLPQGNFISSFLANFFLLPLDKEFQTSAKNPGVKYFRYMDDVRIFTKTRKDARLAIFKMARILRSLHLNVQTAKTRIYEEARGEISQLLIDKRLDNLNDIIDDIDNDSQAGNLSNAKKNNYLERLEKIARDGTIPGRPKIIGARTSLEGLSLRVFFRWITAHKKIEEDIYINRLLAEIAKSANSRLTDKLLSTTRSFPRKKVIETKILNFINSGNIIFPYQEASCLRALRYLSRLNKETIDHCWKKLRNSNEERYLRMESAYLLSRTEIAQTDLKNLKSTFDTEPDVYIQVAMATILIQYRNQSQSIVKCLVFHPNEKVRNAGKFFYTIQNNKKDAKESLEHALNSDVPWLICDYMPIIHLVSQSKNREILQLLRDQIREPRRNHPITGVRDILKKIFTRTRLSLRN